MVSCNWSGCSCNQGYKKNKDVKHPPLKHRNLAISTTTHEKGITLELWRCIGNAKDQTGLRLGETFKFHLSKKEACRLASALLESARTSSGK